MIIAQNVPIHQFQGLILSLVQHVKIPMSCKILFASKQNFLIVKKSMRMIMRNVQNAQKVIGSCLIPMNVNQNVLMDIQSEETIKSVLKQQVEIKV